LSKAIREAEKKARERELAKKHIIKEHVRLGLVTPEGAELRLGLAAERELSHLLSDIATFNLDRQDIIKRITTIRDSLRREIWAAGYKGRF